jgi:hypothetical protein
LFRRQKSAPTAATEPQAPLTPRPGSKGRPTRTRKEALEARRQAAKAARNPKAAKGAARKARVERSQDIRARMKAGDERYLMKRDQGPVRRFVRDFVDARLSMAEFAMPMLVISLVASMVGASEVGTGILNATVLVVIIDSILLRWRLRQQVKKRFGKEHLRGVTFYALMRALQMRFLRIPKPQVRLGQPLTGHYPQP